MTDEYEKIAGELIDIVEEVQTETGMSAADAIALAAAAQQALILSDAVVVLGDIADALNDMRLPVDPAKLH